MKRGRKKSSPRKRRGHRNQSSFRENSLGQVLSSSSSLKQAFSYNRFASDKLTVLMFGSSYLLRFECQAALEHLGHRVVEIDVSGSGDAPVKSLLRGLLEEKPDFILSINHRHFDADGVLGQLLSEFKIPICVWYVDNPLFNIKNNSFPSPDMTTVAVWEKSLVNPVKAAFGVEDVHYLPLATNPKWFYPRRLTPKYDTCFVGDSMEFAMQKWRAMLGHNLWQTALTLADEMRSRGRVEAQSLADPSHIKTIDGNKQWETVTAATWIASSDYRREILTSLNQEHLVVFGDEYWNKLLPKAECHGCIQYGEELSCIYESSKININNTSWQMPHAVNQRVFDAPSCGGFLLSDNQKDLHDHFEVGREIIVYDNIEHLKELSDYYLRHDTQRASIIQRGRNRVLSDHTYVIRFQKLLSILRKRHGKSKTAPVSPKTDDNCPKSSATELPLVSILMSTHNREDYLPRTLASVKAQSFANWELILINDGGPTIQALVEAEHDDRIRLFELRQNGGKGAAINYAYKQSRGEYLAYLDDDDIWYKDHLENLTHVFLTSDDVEMAYTNAIDVTLEESTDGTIQETKRELRYDRQVDIDDLLEVNYIQGITVAHKRSLFEPAGGMDENLSVLLDWDLWRSLASLTKPHHVNKVTAEHFLRKGILAEKKPQITTLATTDTVRYMENRLRIVNKELPGQLSKEQFMKLKKIRHIVECDTLVSKGYYQERAANTVAAMNYYSQALEILPNHVMASRFLGLLEIKANNPRRALELFATCIGALEPEVSDYLHGALAALLCKEPDTTENYLETLCCRNNLDKQTLSIIEMYKQKSSLLKETMNKQFQ